MKKYIAYYRVSTDKQGESGLGLDAQKDTVMRFIENEQNRTYRLNNDNVVRMSLYAEFQEVESGRNDFRPKIHEAIRLCRQLIAKGEDVVLLIAKLDRLSRSIQFIATMQNSNIKFTCCDMPDANDLTIGVMAVFAQNEAKMASIRTKSALESKVRNNPEGWYDKNGELRTKLGNPINFNNDGRKKGGETMKKEAEQNPVNIRAMNYSQTLRNMGMTYAQIANKLNLDGFRTTNGADFMPMQVKRLLDRKNQSKKTA